DDVQPMVAALFARACTAVDRQPELGLAFARELKGFRQHANDRRRTPIEGDRAADDGGVEGEAPLPEAVRDDDDLRRVRGVLAGREGAPEDSMDTEHVEEVRRRARR